MPSAQAIRAGAAYIELYANDNRLVRGLKAAQKKLQNFGASVRAIGMRMLTLGGMVAGPLALTVKAASDMEETMNKFNVVFGSNASAVKAWGDEFAAQVGRSKQQVASFMAGTQDLLVPIGFEAGAATGMSKQITQLAVDLASFNNMADADTLRDLHAALTGSGEVMKKYGVLVSEAAVKQELFNQGVDPKKATEQQKVLARLNIIMRGTTAAQGDAIRSSGSFANQMKALRAKLSDAAVEIGSSLLPVITPLVTQITSAVEVAAEWIKQNQSLVVTLFKVGAAVAVGGMALVALGTAASGLGAVFGMVSAVITGVGTAVGVLGTMLAALLSPIGLVVAGIVGLATYLITSTDAGGEAMAWLGSRFNALKETALAAFQGIGDALAAGDIGLAAKILWLTLKMEWQKGTDSLQKRWLGFKNSFMRIYKDAVFAIAGYSTDAWAGMQVAWVETTAFLGKSWSQFITYLMKNWNKFAGFFKKVWARVKAAFKDTDAEKEIARINREVAEQNEVIEESRDEAIAEREAFRKKRRAEIEEQHEGTQDVLDDMHQREQKEREAKHQAALAASEDKLGKARQEWQDAIDEAARKRAATESEDEDEGPDRLETFQQKLSEIGGEEGALAQAEKRTVDVQGSFNAAAIRGLGAGDAADRTAKAVEQIAGINKKLLKEAQHGGLVFA
jgi:hypothetical protein